MQLSKRFNRANAKFKRIQDQLFRYGAWNSTSPNHEYWCTRLDKAAKESVAARTIEDWRILDPEVPLTIEEFNKQFITE